MGTSLMAQWLDLYASTPWGMGLIPGLGTKILQDARDLQDFLGDSQKILKKNWRIHKLKITFW